MNLQSYEATMQIGTHLEPLCLYFERVIEQLEVQVFVKVLIPKTALNSMAIKQARKIIMLDRLG